MSKENSPAKESQGDADPWATLTLREVQPSGEASVVDLLDALGAMLTLDDAVGGVETRDPGLFGAEVSVPDLVVYTTPPHVERLEARAGSVARKMGLDLSCTTLVRTDDDWRDSWKQYYQRTSLAGGRLLLRPSWLAREPGDPQRELVLDPGRAFGTGLHESTRLCLDALLREVEPDQGPADVLDLGCGSGILGLALLCASDKVQRVLFVDIDPESVDTARENAELNDQLARSLFQSGVLADLAPATHDFVLANIRPSVLVPQAEGIAARVAPGGDLLLSGILLEEEGNVATAYEKRGLELVARHELNDWCALHYRRGAAQ